MCVLVQIYALTGDGFGWIHAKVHPHADALKESFRSTPSTSRHLPFMRIFRSTVERIVDATREKSPIVYLFIFIISYCVLTTMEWCGQVNIVRWSLANLYSAELGSVVRGAKHVRVASIGGGIGSELLGLAVSLSEREQAECEIRASFLEPHNAWESERHAVCAAVACGGWNTEICSVDMHGDPSVADLHLRQAHLVCLVHCLSVLPGDLCARWLPRVLAMTQPGAVVLLVDFQGQRMASLSETICRSGFRSVFPSPVHAPSGMDSVPNVERANLLASFKDWKNDWGSLPLLQCPSYVQVFTKPHTLLHIGTTRPVLEPLPLTPAIHRVIEDKSPSFNACQSSVSKGLMSLCGTPLAGMGTGIGIGACNTPSPRESGEIESGEVEDSLSIGEVRILCREGEGAGESPGNTVQGNALPSRATATQPVLMERPIEGNGDRLKGDLTRDASDPHTSDLTIGIQLFAKYMVGSQEVVASSFSEARQRVLVDKPANAPQANDQTEPSHGEQKPKILEWVHRNQRPEKKQRINFGDGFTGRFQKNNEPRQTHMISSGSVQAGSGMGALTLTNKENNLSGPQGQMTLRLGR